MNRHPAERRKNEAAVRKRCALCDDEDRSLRGGEVGSLHISEHESQTELCRPMIRECKGRDESNDATSAWGKAG